MLLSVIVPTCDRYATLSQCLKRLAPLSQNLGNDIYEVIVTDDSSTDCRERLAVDFPWAKWNRGPRKGPAANRNSGAVFAHGDWLVFVDDDCLPAANLLTAYQTALSKNPESLAFEGAILPERPQRRLDEEAPFNDHGGRFWSCNIMVQRVLFNSLDGFCELFLYAAMEDVDLRERLKKRGIVPVFLPDASVIHPWRTFGSDQRYFDVQVHCHLVFYKRHPEMWPSFANFGRQLVHVWLRDYVRGCFRYHFRGAGRAFFRTLTVSKTIARLALAKCRA